MRRRFAPARHGLLAVLALLSSTAAPTAGDYDYAARIEAVAGDIAAITTAFPQLRDFSATRNVTIDKLAIDYAYHTHHYTGPRGGWVAHAPNPDDDGVWFYIDLHDPDFYGADPYPTRDARHLLRRETRDVSDSRRQAHQAAGRTHQGDPRRARHQALRRLGRL